MQKACGLTFGAERLCLGLGAFCREVLTYASGFFAGRSGGKPTLVAFRFLTLAESFIALVFYESDSISGFLKSLLVLLGVPNILNSLNFD